MSTYKPLSDSAVIVDDGGSLGAGPGSAVSWAAIFVGAAAAAALSLVLVILGFGLGLSAISPWSNAGASAQTIGVSTIIWVAFTQLAAAAIGGYLAGRLRSRWVGLHTDETYFRDTAHGFMAWAIATLGTAALLGSVMTGIVSGGVQAASSVAGAAAHTAASATGAMAESEHGGANATNSLDYFVDSMFRKATTATAAADSTAPAEAARTPASPAIRAEAVRIFANDIHDGALPDADRQYLGTVVAQEAGIPQADAEQRVTTAYTKVTTAITDATNKAKEAADAARKAAAHSALWMFVALMIGAFFASLAATFGGRRRDLFA